MRLRNATAVVRRWLKAYGGIVAGFPGEPGEPAQPAGRPVRVSLQSAKTCSHPAVCAFGQFPKRQEKTTSKVIFPFVFSIILLKMISKCEFKGFVGIKFGQLKLFLLSHSY